MSESTNASGDPAGNTQLTVSTMRALTLQALRFRAATSHLKILDGAGDALATILLCASLMLEYPELFDAAVVSRAREILKEHEISILPGAELPPWVYQSLRELVLEPKGQTTSLLHILATQALKSVNNPHDREATLSVLLEQAVDVTLQILTASWPDLPLTAVGTASIVLEYSDLFPLELRDAAISVLASLGQSIEPGAQLTITQKLLDATAKGLEYGHTRTFRLLRIIVKSASTPPFDFDARMN